MTGTDQRPLAARGENYDAVGATRPADAAWPQHPAGFRTFERTVRIGHGQERWQQACSTLFAWGVKTRSGFAVEPAHGAVDRVRPDERYWLVARLGPFAVREPVRVVAVVDGPDRCGFAYGTLEGHPVSGEEAFILHRTPDDVVWLTLRSLTRAPRGRWRPAFPAALLAQRCYRRRYLRALNG